MNDRLRLKGICSWSRDLFTL